MALAKFWIGNAFGTNTGNLFVELEGKDKDLSGTLRLNEPGVGPVIYKITGTFDGTQLFLKGKPETQIPGMVFGDLEATATLAAKGFLQGRWETTIGSAGTFILSPHDQQAGSSVPDQIHTARHNLGAIEIDREEIITLAEKIRRDFKTGQVVITVSGKTEQSRFLENFKDLIFNEDRATIIKLFAQEPKGGGINKIVSIEFSPFINQIMTQGSDEIWVLGTLEKIKNEVRKFERSYATNIIKRLGWGLQQILPVAAVVYLPSLENLPQRAIFMLGILVLAEGFIKVHNRVLPHAAIYLGKKPEGLLNKISPSIVSWFFGVLAGVVAIIFAGLLQGWLGLIPIG